MKFSGLRLLAVALLAVALAGCGGVNAAPSAPSTPPANPGGGSSSPAPQVVKTTPATGATCVSTIEAITATFNEALDSTTVNSTTFSIQGVTGAVSYDASSMTAMLSPSAALPGNTPLTITLTTGIASSTGVHMASNFQSSFTTGPCNPPPPPASAAEFVYAANLNNGSNNGGNVSGFAIDQKTGSLTPLATSPFSGGDNPVTIASDRQGHHVFVGEDRSQPSSSKSGDGSCTNFHGLLLSENVDPQSGALSTAQSLNLNGSCPSSIVVDPEGKNLYVATIAFGSTQGQIEAYAIGTTGTITAVTGAPLATPHFIDGLAMHPSGKFVYAATEDDAAGILVFSRDPATGVLTQQQKVATDTKFRLAMLPAGDSLVAVSRFDRHAITLFTIDQTAGQLTARSSVTVNGTERIAAAPSGNFVAVTSIAVTPSDSSGVAVYQVDSAKGTLTQIKGSPFPDGDSPFDVQFDPQGDFVYSTSNSTVRGFSFNQSSGALSPTPQPSVSTSAVSVITVVKPQ